MILDFSEGNLKLAQLMPPLWLRRPSQNRQAFSAFDTRRFLRMKGQSIPVKPIMINVVNSPSMSALTILPMFSLRHFSRSPRSALCWLWPFRNAWEKSKKFKQKKINPVGHRGEYQIRLNFCQHSDPNKR